MSDDGKVVPKKVHRHLTVWILWQQFKQQLPYVGM
jgi:hypothetical protein